MAKGLGDFRGSLHAQIVGAGLVVGHLLQVKYHWVGDGIPLQGIQHILRLLHRFLYGDGLGEEVHPHVQPRLGGSLDVLLELVIQHQVARLPVAPEAQAYHGKGDAVGLHCRPVDVPVVGGHVHPCQGLSTVWGGVLVAAILLAQPAPVVAVLGQVVLEGRNGDAVGPHIYIGLGEQLLEKGGGEAVLVGQVPDGALGHGVLQQPLHPVVELIYLPAQAAEDGHCHTQSQRPCFPRPFLFL